MSTFKPDAEASKTLFSCENDGLIESSNQFYPNSQEAYPKGHKPNYPKRHTPLDNPFPNCPLCAGTTTLYKFHAARVIVCHRCETVIIEGDNDFHWAVQDAA